MGCNQERFHRASCAGLTGSRAILASSHFIGASGDNFSHFFEGRGGEVCSVSKQVVPEQDKGCLKARHSMYEFGAGECLVQDSGEAAR